MSASESTRAFGPFLVVWSPSARSLAVALNLLQVQIWQAGLTPEGPKAVVDVHNSNGSATGTILAQFSVDDHGYLQGENLVFNAPNFALTFTGTIGIW